MPAPVRRVPVTFSDFHTAAAAIDYLRRVAAANPGLTELIEIGQSRSGQPILVLVVSNMTTGVALEGLVPREHLRTPTVNDVKAAKLYQAKPGQWIDGGQQGAERAGPEACLYIIDKLLAGYGTDADLTRLVNDNVFYVCPLPNPERHGGAARPDAQNDVRATWNGNYPEGWWKDDGTPGGTGDYPSSLPEARATLEFLTNHPNILLVQSFEATGGRSVRPFARWPDSRIDARDLAVFDRVIGKKYLELVGEAVPSSWNAPLERASAGATEHAAPTRSGGGRRGTAPGGQVGTAGLEAGTVPAVEQPRGWRSPYNAEQQAPAGFGAFFDWAYAQFGAFAMATGLADADRDPNGITGGERLLALCETAWQFERFKATLLPRLEIREAAAKVLRTTNQAPPAAATETDSGVGPKKGDTPGRYRIVHVTATLENAGVLPTAVAQGPWLRRNREEDAVWLLGGGTTMTFLQGSRWTRLGTLQGSVGAVPALQAGSSRTVSWLVAVEGDAPLKLVLTSLKGGIAVKDLVIE